ncbi:MAG: GMP synthase (glutamine-hydrolyzing), partial [Clostridia bacterium]|nr:GMP synthase (glutamine-hydrolyzing) [Clostridia bacterium]
METLISTIKEISAGRAVVLPVFGDAESMATAYLAVKALGGDKVNAVHIDHGMLRHGETKAVRASLERIGVGNIICET